MFGTIYTYLAIFSKGKLNDHAYFSRILKLLYYMMMMECRK